MPGADYDRRIELKRSSLDRRGKLPQLADRQAAVVALQEYCGSWRPVPIASTGAHLAGRRSSDVYRAGHDLQQKTPRPFACFPVEA